MLERLRAFTCVARHGTLRAAASELLVTQPSLTARIAALEQEIGVRLFARSSKGMRLTAEGQAFLPYAEEALAAVEKGRRHVARVGSGAAGELALGVAPAVGTYVLPAALKLFASRHPDVELSVRTGHSDQIVDLVLADEVGLGLVRGLSHPELRRDFLFADELVLVTDPAHRFALEGRVRVEQLGRERLIMFDRASSYHEQTAIAFTQAGITPRTTMELDNIDAAKKMVELGLGVSLLPYSAVATEVERGTLAAILIVGAARMTREVIAIARRDSGPPSAAERALLECVRETAPAKPTHTIDAGALAEAFGVG